MAGQKDRETILSARKMVDNALCKESRACFNSEEWKLEMTESSLGMERKLNG